MMTSPSDLALFPKTMCFVEFFGVLQKTRRMLLSLSQSCAMTIQILAKCIFKKHLHVKLDVYYPILNLECDSLDSHSQLLPILFLPRTRSERLTTQCTVKHVSYLHAIGVISIARYFHACWCILSKPHYRGNPRLTYAYIICHNQYG